MSLVVDELRHDGCRPFRLQVFYPGTVEQYLIEELQAARQRRRRSLEGVVRQIKEAFEGGAISEQVKDNLLLNARPKEIVGSPCV